ncbi:S-layer homology domain-containing protein, partial [Paenibacillus sp. TAF58]
LLKDTNAAASPIFEILKNFTENFSKPITLNFVFDPKLVKNNQKASVFYFDESKKVWVEVPGGKVNGDNITVQVDHFTKYAVFAVGQESVVPVNPLITFSDITGHWADALIKQAVSAGIVTGYPDGTFKPNHTVTRAEFAVMLMNTLKPKGEGVALTFTDTVKIGPWAQKAVAQAVQAGIITGYEDGSFRPDAQITRAEMAAMLAKVLGQSNEASASTGFADDKDIPVWAKGSVAYVKQAGIVQGKGDNKFAPQDHTTRAEAVTVLLKVSAEKNK